MNVDAILVPFDSARRGERMGAGPHALVAAGLVERLERAGHRVACDTVEPPAASWRAEIRTAFDLAAGIATRVRAARAAGRFPLVLAGNCNAALGVVAALGAETSVVWCDAHADLNTPDTTTSGLLDGMSLAALTGRCWRAIASGIPGFVPLPDAAVRLVGAHDIDPAERDALRASAIRHEPASALGASLAERVRAQLPAAAPLYLHLDLDVLDVAEGRANAYATSGGASARGLRAFCEALGAPDAVTLSAYDPAADGDRRVQEVALAAVEALLGARGSHGADGDA